MIFKDAYGSSMVVTKNNLLLIAFANCISQASAEFILQQTIALTKELNPNPWGVLFKSVGRFDLSPAAKATLVHVVDYCFSHGCCCDAWVLRCAYSLNVMHRIRTRCGISPSIENINFVMSEQAQDYLVNSLKIEQS